jgi:hypothetical protein
MHVLHNITPAPGLENCFAIALLYLEIAEKAIPHKPLASVEQMRYDTLVLRTL